jgi:hypothetical protein
MKALADQTGLQGLLKKKFEKCRKDSEKGLAL